MRIPVAACAVAVALAPAAHQVPVDLGWQNRALPVLDDDASCERPSDVLDLSNWKLQAADSEPGGSKEGPMEILQPELGNRIVSAVFEVTPGCEAVVFSAGVDGATTKGSKYPRSELREMTDGGGSEAAWSSSSGVHTLTVTEAFTHLPNDKPHLVSAQIHDGKDDVSVFRLEGTKLYVTDGDNAQANLIDGNYEIGTPFEAKFVVQGGEVKAYYNGQLKVTMKKSFSGGYFKVGAYTQANCENSKPCEFDNYGQVAVLDLQVSHSDTATD
ncbi:MAG: polysaccharide lyase family 7 protein [Pseudonocardia sp.]